MLYVYFYDIFSMNTTLTTSSQSLESASSAPRESSEILQATTDRLVAVICANLSGTGKHAKTRREYLCKYA